MQLEIVLFSLLFTLKSSLKSGIQYAMAKKPEVTVSKDYLKNLEKKVEDLKTLMEVSAIISSTLDFNELMTLVMEKAKNVMDAEACSILLSNKDTDRLEFELALSRGKG